MGFDHKAYAFDWQAFAAELMPWMSEALAADDKERFARFVVSNIARCRSPYDGSALSSSWKELLEVGDVQEVADFALTKYYDPTDDHGLGDTWMEEEAALPENMRPALLGRPISHFDPGRQGSYVVTPNKATEGAEILRHAKSPQVREYARFLEDVSRKCLGVYVTF